MKKELQLQILTLAKIEIADAFDYYEKQKTGLGEVFLAELLKDLNAIKKAPNGYTVVNHHRQFLMKKFPFAILYEVDQNKLYIDAVFHTNRNPEKKKR